MGESVWAIATIYIDSKGNLNICLQVSAEKKRQKYSKPIVDKFLEWVESSPFYGKNALGESSRIHIEQGIWAKSIS